MSTDNNNQQGIEDQEDLQDKEISNRNEEAGTQDIEVNDFKAEEDNNDNDNDISVYKADLEKEKDRYLRLYAEFENYKRRTSKERAELFKTAGQDVMHSMLPVLDDFDRAKGVIAKAKDKNLLKGVELISGKLRETLMAKGLTEMTIKPGDQFDAEIHEAITQIPAPNEDLKGKVVDVVEKGYKLGEKIIRFPKVVVGK